MRRLILIISLVLLPAVSFAEWAWLRGSAVSEFTEEDWVYLKDAGAAVLANDPDGTAVSWENPRSGAHGLIKPLATFMQKGEPCRTTAFKHASSKGTQGQGILTLCKQADGAWKLAPSE